MLNNRKVIGFLPIRSGSKAIPLKNIKNFCGKPLAYWVLHALQHSKEIDVVYVALDCNEFASIVSSFNFSKVRIYNRDPKNATDEASTESVMLEFLNSEKFKDNDIFMLVQATSPFTKPIDIKNSVKTYMDSDCDSVLSCVRVKRFFWDESGHALNYNFFDRPLKQDFSGQFLENGALYINSVGNIKKEKNRLSGKIKIYEMPEYAGIELDEEGDWAIAEILMKKTLFDHKKKSPIRLVATDVDGVLTDSGMYYSQSGDELKKFNTRDGKAVELLRKLKIKTAIITSENTDIVSNRAKKLKVDYVFQGAKDKLRILKDISTKEGISLSQTAYIGDDLNDLEVLNNVGMALCPNDAVEKIKKIDGISVLNAKGGKGVLREFVEKFILK